MRRLLVFASFFLVLAVVLVVISRQRASNRIAALTGSEPGAPAEHGAASTLDAPAAATGDAALAPLDDALGSRSSAPATSSSSASTRAVRGVVTALQGCPDPSAEILALAREMTIESYFAEESLAIEASDVAGTAKFTPSKITLARAPIGEHGRFEITLPEGHDSVHVIVLGDFWFSRTTIEARPGADAALSAECGARLDVAFALPQELEARAGEIDGLSVTARPREAGGSFQTVGPSRRVRVKDVRAVFRALEAKWSFEIEGRPTFVAAFTAMASELAPGKTKTLSITLARGGTLRGIVRVANGGPLAGADVEARRPGRFFGFDDRPVREGKSAADGTFELAAVAAGPLTLVGEKDGYVESEPQKLELADGGTLAGLEVALDAGGSISGLIVWPDGTPASTIDVKAGLDVSQRVGMNAFNARRGTDGSTPSRADGTFEVAGLQGGPFTVTARALPKEAKAEIDALDGDAKKRRRNELELHARIEEVVVGTSDLKLVLAAPLALSGRAVDSSGAPVTKFDVRAQASGKGMFGDLGRDAVERDFTDEKGAFQVPLETAGTWKVSVRAEGYARMEPLDVVVPRAETDGELVIALEKQCVVSGFVRDAAGAPIANAEVWRVDGQPGFMRQIERARGETPARSDAQGAFRLERLKSGHMAIIADHEEHAQSLEVKLDLATGEERADVVLVLRTGGTLTGEVYEDGKALASYLVQATEMKNYAQATGFTDGEGRFRMEHLEPGGYQVVAMPASGDDSQVDATAMFQKMKMSMTDVREGETTHVVLGAKPRAPVKVHGRVTHAGEPYTGASLSFFPSGKNGLAALKLATIGGDGGYEVVLDKPGDYVATVQRFGSADMSQQSATETACTIPEAEEYELDIAIPTGRVSGRVEAPDGSAAALVRVSVLPKTGQQSGTMWGGQYHELATNSEGRYDVQALRPGRYVIAIGGMELGGMFGAAAKHGRELREVTVSEGEWQRDVDFRLKEPANVEVTVVDESGVPVESAAVFARDERGQLLDRFSLVSTDPGGIAKYGGLAPGKYFFSARKEARASAESALVELGENEAASARVQIVAATKLIVKVTDDGKPAHASLSVVDSAGREHAGVFALTDLQEMFAQDGFQPNELRVGPLAPGKYVVRATGAEGKKAERSLTLSGAPEKKITMELR